MFIILDMSKEEQDNEILTERRMLIGGAGLLASGLFGAGSWSAKSLYDESVWKDEQRDPVIEEFLGSLRNFESDKFNTAPEGVAVNGYNTSLDNRGLELRVDTPNLIEDVARNVDVEDNSALYELEISPDDAKTLFLTEDYLEDGRELFGEYARHFKDLEELDQIRLKYRNNVDPYNTVGFEFEVQTDEIGDNPEDQYEELVSNHLEESY